MSTFFEGADDREPAQALLADSLRLAQAFAAVKNATLRLALVGLVEKLAASMPQENGPAADSARFGPRAASIQKGRVLRPARVRISRRLERNDLYRRASSRSKIAPAQRSFARMFR